MEEKTCYNLVDTLNNDKINNNYTHKFTQFPPHKNYFVKADSGAPTRSFSIDDKSFFKQYQSNRKWTVL